MSTHFLLHVCYTPVPVTHLLHTCSTLSWYEPMGYCTLEVSMWNLSAGPGHCTSGLSLSLKSHLSTHTSVFGTSPPKRHAPDSPGRKRVATLGNALASRTNGAKQPAPSGQSKGQNGAIVHTGTSMVALAIHTCACRMILGIRLIGGQTQLFSLPQSTVKASTASEPGLQHLLLKRVVWQFCQLANRSTECGPQSLSTSANTTGFSIQSS